MQNQHAAEKIRQSKTYKKQVKDLNEQLALMKRKEMEKNKLEGLIRKSEEMVNRLKSDVNRIKGQKAGIAKQMSELQQVNEPFGKLWSPFDICLCALKLKRLHLLLQSSASCLLAAAGEPPNVSQTACMNVTLHHDCWLTVLMSCNSAHSSS